MTNTDFTARCMAGKALEDVAGKQDVITDLDAIRAGAAAGATAVQPEALEDYQPKIDTIHKLDAGFVDDTNSANKFATQAQLDQIGINENNISSLTGEFNQLGNVIYAKPLSELTFTKSLGGLYYSNDIDISSDFYEVFAAGLENFSNTPNIGINVMVRNNLTLVVVVCDPTNPPSLSFSGGSITMRVFGRKK